MNGGFFVGKMVATGFRVRPAGAGSKEEVRWKEQNDVGKRGGRAYATPPMTVGPSWVGTQAQAMMLLLLGGQNADEGREIVGDAKAISVPVRLPHEDGGEVGTTGGNRRGRRGKEKLLLGCGIDIPAKLDVQSGIDIKTMQGSDCGQGC